MRIRLSVFFILISFYSFSQSYYMFVGTYTTGDSKGIYVYRFDAATGKAEAVSNTEGNVVNPSYLTVSPQGNFVYAVNETNGEHPGQVSAFSFNRSTGKLSFINQQPSGGDDPCYISESKNGKWVFVANYSSGSLAALPVAKNGSLEPYAQLFQDSGSSIVKDRQEKAHVHSAVLSPDQHYLFSADLGTDKEMVYQLNSEAEKPLKRATPSFVATTAGTGPRHFTFHPNKKYAYLIEELGGNVVAYAYHNGKLTFLQSIDAHPASYKGALGSADIHISPDGKFLYASNRGDENTITIFAINQKTGKLTLKGYQASGGTMPRNFIIDPSGKYLLVAHQQSGNIVVFKRSSQTGMLRPTGYEIKVPNPVCIQMLK